MKPTLLSTTRPEIHRQRCLNFRQGVVSCRVCVRICPHHAIEFIGPAIRIDASLCDDCGLCSIDCPTETFEQADFSPMTLLQRVQDQKQLTLYCRMAQVPADNPDAITIPCIGLLEVQLLIALNCTGIEEIYLHGLHQCKHCPTRVGRRRLSTTLLETKPPLKKHFPTIHSDHTTVQFQSIQQFQPTPQVATQRRVFLQKMVYSSSQLAAFAMLQVLPFNNPNFNLKPNPNDGVVLSKQDYMKKHLPQQHKLAVVNLRSMRGLNEQQPAEIPWFTQIQAAGNCNVCGSCALICPSGAITINHREQHWLVRFQAAGCIGCNLCVSLCPEHALQAANGAWEKILAEDSTVSLFECEEQQCQHCDKTFVNTNKQSALCPVCQNNQTIENDLFGNTEFFRITKPGR